MPNDLIESLEYSWLNTFGNEKDVHYFTPCILASCLSQPNLCDITYTYELLVKAGLFDWSPNHQKAVKRACIAMYKEAGEKIPNEISRI